MERRVTSGTAQKLIRISSFIRRLTNNIVCVLYSMAMGGGPLGCLYVN